MTERLSFDEFDREVAAFQRRLEELRTLRALGTADDEAVEAVFLELETAAEELRAAHEELLASSNELAQRNPPGDPDRTILESVFRELPVAVILLDPDARIRRVNQQAVDLLGVGADYLSGRLFPVFVELPQRAALRSHLAALTRGRARGAVLSTKLLRQGRSTPARLVLSSVHVPADPRPLVAVVALPADPTAPSAAPHRGHEQPTGRLAEPDGAAGIRATVRRLDLVTASALVLLEERGNPEAVIVQSLATWLCQHFADWVIVDLVRARELSRVTVCGPGDPAALALAAEVERAPLDKSELPCAVIDGDRSWLEAHVQDPGILGEDDRAVPFLSALGVHSILSVPISNDKQNLGALTALQGRERAPFGLVDQGGLQDVARLLARALVGARQDILRPGRVAVVPAALVPRDVPSPPGLQVAWLQRSAGYEHGAAAAFLDVYPSETGWGAALGGTHTGGLLAADVLTELRHWARVVGSTESDPAAVLRRLNAALRSYGDGHLVSAAALQLEISDGRAGLRLASAGHRSSLVLRVDGRVQRVDGGGAPLGGSAEAAVQAEDAFLAEGELVLFYNNALHDSRNDEGEGFGQSGRLSAAAAHAHGGSAQEVVNAVDEALTAFSGDAAGDDAVAVGIRFTGVGPG